MPKNMAAFEAEACWIGPGPTAETMTLCLDDAHRDALVNILAGAGFALPDGASKDGFNVYPLTADVSVDIINTLTEFMDGSDGISAAQRDLILIFSAHSANIEESI